jgi:hypothetical protein
MDLAHLWVEGIVLAEFIAYGVRVGHCAQSDVIAAAREAWVAF